MSINNYILVYTYSGFSCQYIIVLYEFHLITFCLWPIVKYVRTCVLCVQKKTRMNDIFSSNWYWTTTTLIYKYSCMFYLLTKPRPHTAPTLIYLSLNWIYIPYISCIFIDDIWYALVDVFDALLLLLLLIIYYSSSLHIYILYNLFIYWRIFV